ncbi:hypothetical protein [Streptomyces sp. L7]|uniref:hypothetical protein n=1 Tax=Streptomyces sp. L7 TaxID=3423954 RepID=UPI003D971B85
MPTFTDLDFVADIELDDASVLVHRLGRPPVRLVLTSADPTTDAEITAAHDIHNDVKFVISVPRDGRILGSAFNRCSELGLGIGHVGDAMRAIRDEDDPSKHVSREYAFVSRGLNQHSAIAKVVRLDDKRLRIERRSLPALVAFIAPEYQPTADSVRNAVARYDAFDVFVATNPNSDPTPEAIAAGTAAGVGVLKWSPFLAYLHRA